MLAELLPEGTPSKEYLVEGARLGFSLGSTGPALVEQEGGGWRVDNYPSAELWEKSLEKHWEKEVELGRVSETDASPTASIAVLPKDPQGERIRVISDLSLRTASGAIGANATVDTATLPAIRLPSIRMIRAEAPFGPGVRAAVLDISEAYRHVPIREEGAAIRYRAGRRVFADQRLPMGHAASACIMQRLLEGIVYALCAAVPGVRVWAYIDDVLIIGDEEATHRAYLLLRLWLSRLHLYPARNKLQAPSKEVRYLGFILNVEEGRVEVDDGRRTKLERALAALHRQLDRNGATEQLARQARRLAGKLHFISGVCPHMRVFMRGLELLGSSITGKPVRGGAPVWREAWAEAAACRDSPAGPPTSTATAAAAGAGTQPSASRAAQYRRVQGRALTLRWSGAIRRILASPISERFRTPPPPETPTPWTVYSDASTQGGGICALRHPDQRAIFIRVRFPAPTVAKRIAFAELAMVGLCLRDELLPLSGERVTWALDNHASVDVLVQGWARSPDMANLLAMATEHATRGRVAPCYIFLPGEANTKADYLSRTPNVESDGEELRRRFPELREWRIEVKTVHTPSEIWRWVSPQSRRSKRRDSGLERSEQPTSVFPSSL